GRELLGRELDRSPRAARLERKARVLVGDDEEILAAKRNIDDAFGEPLAKELLDPVDLAHREIGDARSPEDEIAVVVDVILSRVPLVEEAGGAQLAANAFERARPASILPRPSHRHHGPAAHARRAQEGVLVAAQELRGLVGALPADAKREGKMLGGLDDLERAFGIDLRIDVAREEKVRADAPLVMDDGLEPDHRGVHLLGGVRLEELSELLRDEGVELRDEGGEQSLFRSVPRDERDLRLWEQRGCLGSRLHLGFATVGSAHDISFSSRFSRSSRSSPVGLASARPGASSG